MLRAFKQHNFVDQIVQRFQDNVAQWAKQFDTTRLSENVHVMNYSETPLHKPGFSYNGTTSVKVAASTTKPVVFAIGGMRYEVITDLLCDLTFSGVGGLDSGAIAANTIYYLYATVKGGAVLLIASTRDPNSGPINIGVWTYLGSFQTASGSAVLVSFGYANGTYIGDETTSVSHTGNTSWTSKTIKLPTTARFAIGEIGVTWSAAGWVGVAGTSAPVGIGAYTEVGSGITGNFFSPGGHVPILTAQTVWIKTSVAGNTGYFQVYGWIEDAMEWK